MPLVIFCTAGAYLYGGINAAAWGALIASAVVMFVIVASEHNS